MILAALLATVSASDALSPEEVLARSLAEELKDHRVVGLGEGTHGSSEFQDFRLFVARELIERHGFAAVALEDPIGAVVRLPGASPLLEEGRPHYGIYYKSGSHPLMRWLKDHREMALVGVDRTWSDEDYVTRRLGRYGVTPETPTERIPAAVRAAGGAEIEVAYALAMRTNLQRMEAAPRRQRLVSRDRDDIMASNLEWLADVVGPVVFLAHNGHVMKVEGRAGGFLSDRLGPGYAAVGTSALGGCTTVWHDEQLSIPLDPPHPRAIEADLALGQDGLAWIRRGDSAALDASERMLLVGATGWPRHHQRLSRPVTEALDHLVVFDSVADTAERGCDTPWRR